MDQENHRNQRHYYLLIWFRLHHLEGDHESAIQVLNRATENNSSFAPIYHAKADLLLELKREDDALSCLLEGLEKTFDKQNQIHLYLLAGIVFRQRGELKTALNFAQEGLSLCTNETDKIDHVDSAVIEITTLITDLYQAILRPNRGRLLFKEMERKLKIDVTEDIDYCCSYVELFFDNRR
jgi:tetratricopeptide (TPR) repeat protein